MWSMFNTIAQNIGVDIDQGIILIVFLLGIIWYAKGVKVGASVNMLIFAGIFVWFYQDGTLNWLLPLTLVILHIVILSISLYAQAQEAATIT